MAVRHDVRLGKQGGVFQVAVGDAAVGIFGCDEVCLDVVREGHSPVVALAGVVEVHSSHSSAGSVGGPDERGFLRHQFRQVSGAGA